jgi:glycosyltransferase involved in cell wall biosynthesis
MRILSLAPTSFFNDYGCHVRILEEARALQALGHDVTVVTYYKGKDVPGLRVIRTAPTPWHKDYEVGSSRHKFAFDLLLAIRLVRVLSRNRFDVIHAHLHEGALIGGVIGRLFGVPVCFDFQGSLVDEMVMHRFVRRGSPAFKLFSALEQLCERLPNAIVTSTRNAAERLRATYHGRMPIEALPDGVNTRMCDPARIPAAQRAALRALHGIGPDDVCVAFLGLLAEHQGIDNLIAAAALLKPRLSNVKWLVMGYPNEALWRAKSAAAGVSDVMIFTGRVPYEQMPEMLSIGDLAAAPKLSLTEGSGKILNYMALKLPTVAFDTQAQQEILGPLGVYAPTGDSAALAARVFELATQPARRVELGEQLRRRAQQQFSWERAAAILVSVYGQIVKRPAGAQGEGAATTGVPADSTRP